MVIVIGRWTKKVVNFIKDPTNLRLVPGLFLRAEIKRRLMIISSCWPIAASDPSSGHLWNKVM